MALESITRELPPFKLSHLWQLFCTVGFGVCVINFSYSFFTNVSQTLQSYCEHVEDMHVGFGLS